jgi:diamine N-acetyltransferase
VRPAPEDSRAAFRPATCEHLSEIASLAAVIWRMHYPGIISQDQIEYMLARMYDVDVMRRELESGVTYDQLVIEGQLIGFAAYGSTDVRSELKLHKLYIHPDFQRQGLGAMLLAHVEDAAREQNFEIVVLAVNKRNTNAIAAYRKHGFAIRDSIIVDIGGGFVMDDYIMAKTVRK